MHSDSSAVAGVAGRPFRFATRITPLSAMEIVRNFVYVLSYIVLADRYTPYRLAKLLLSRLRVGLPHCVLPPRLGGKLLAIEGCAHSGSSFLRGNIRPDMQHGVLSHIHRQWSLRRCLRHGVPTILLVRDPLDACLSKHSRSVIRQGYGMTISMTAALAVWLAYYRYAWRHRDRLCIIMFPELTDDFGAIRQRIEAWSEARLLEAPTYESQNEFLGARRQLRLSFLSRWLLRAAYVRYHKFELASVQRSAPARFSAMAASPALSGHTTRARTLGIKRAAALLCAAVAFELLADWGLFKEFNLAIFELIGVATAALGFIILIYAVRRIDFIERAGSSLSEHDSARAEWDSAICIAAAILLILPGMGCDLAATMLLLPPVRRFILEYRAKVAL